MAGTKKYDWIKLRRVFTTSNISLREMSRNHNVSYNYLTRKSSAENWFEQRDTMQREAREAVTAALLEQTDERNSELAKIVCKDGDAHLKRSLQTGDKLYTLFQAAVTAMTQGNLKDMRSAIDSWVTLDNQMRKIHGIEDKVEKPLVNINVMAALPTRAEMEAAQATAAKAADEVDVVEAEAEVLQEQTVVPA